MTLARAVWLSVLVVLSPITATAQPTGKVFRLGVLGVGTIEQLRQSLRDVGYVEGTNLAIEWRDPAGKVERYPDLAAQLARLHVDAIVASNPAATLAARRATTSIPIVMVNTPDPVQLGLVTSLARPGANLTGTTTLSADLTTKQLELLKEAVPRAVRIGVMINPNNPWHPLAVQDAEAAARSLGLQLHVVEVRGPGDFEGAFASMTREQASAALVLSDPMTFFHRARLADLSTRRRLPTMHGVRGYVDAGGLMSYWAHQGDLYRRVASFIDRIFKGARPGDLPIEQPTRWELVVNVKTARTIGLPLPPSVLLRADDVIQ